jgi:hypothetical protein
VLVPHLREFFAVGVSSVPVMIVLGAVVTAVWLLFVLSLLSLWNENPGNPIPDGIIRLSLGIIAFSIGLVLFSTYVLQD